MPTGDRFAVGRRTVLTMLGTAASVSLAGCSGDDDDDTSTATPTEDEQSDGTDGSQDAVEISGDASCAVCGMTAANFPEWNGKVRHEDDTEASFCSSGCATTYYAVPEQFSETDAAISDLWVTGFESGEFIDGMDAAYALETDSDRVDDPMRLNPAPFADRADAVAYVDAVEYLTEDDVVELSAFDRELAEQYRGMHLG